MRRLSVSLKNESAMTISKPAIGLQKLAYILCADQSRRYSNKKSRIVYIGTTKKGANRISASIACKGMEALGKRRIKEVTAHIVQCGCRPGLETWKKLEAALLLVFRREYGENPKLNYQKSNIGIERVRQIFSEEKLRKILATYDD